MTIGVFPPSLILTPGLGVGPSHHPGTNRPPHKYKRPLHHRHPAPPITHSPRLPGQLPRCPRRPRGARRGGAVRCLPPCSAWRCGRHLERWQQRLSQGHPEPIRRPCVTCWACCVLPGLLPRLQPRMGRLSRYLARGEYGQLRDCPLFESDFLQVRAVRGGPADASCVPSAMGL